jgi:DNA mismatch repair protein MutS
VPREVIAAARRYLTALESQRDAQAAQATPQAALPFGTPDEPPAAAGDAAAAALRARLAAVKPDELSPRAALDLLYDLQRAARDGRTDPG